MSLELSPEVEHAVRQRAAAKGVSINDLLARTFVLDMQEELLSQDPKERVRALLAEWQAQDNTPRLPPIPMREGETPTAALFRKWEEEDAGMTDEEVKADEQLWEEFRDGVNAERLNAGMRTLF